jgi:LAO/AO transport system kinase
VMQLSALKGTGIREFWETALAFQAQQQQSGQTQSRRRLQDETWMWQRIDAGLRERFRDSTAVQSALPKLTAQVRAGQLSPSVAARQLLDLAL